MSSNYSLVENGKHCVAVASEVLQDIESGRTEVANSKLISIQRDATVLANEGAKLATRLEAADTHYQKKDAELHQQIGKLGVQENQVKENKKNVETRLAQQQSVLQDKQSRLSQAESDLQAAERKLEKAKKEEKNIQIGSTIGGAVLGLFTGGVGFAIGAAAGAGVGAIVNACRDEEKDARSARNRRSNDVDQAVSAIRSSESEISSHLSEIETLASSIQDLEKQRGKLHDKRSEIKAVIPVLKNSTNFWLLFKQLSEHGENRSLLLKKIVGFASKKDSYKVFQSNASQRVVSTFIESWESIGAIAAEGCSDHMFSIEYACTNCRNACNALPHLRGAEFVCLTCHLALTQ